MLWIQVSPTELGEARTINPDLFCLGSHVHPGPFHSPPHSDLFTSQNGKLRMLLEGLRTQVLLLYMFNY